MNSSAAPEIEAKYRIVDPKVSAQLRNRKTLGNQLRLGPVMQADVVDIYVDTKDARLLRSGYALRIRQENEQPLITLKELRTAATDGGSERSPVRNRLELEQPLSTPVTNALDDLLKVKKLPQDIQKAIGNIASGKSKLQPYCTIKQTRHERSIHFSAAKPSTTGKDAVSEQNPPAQADLALLSLDQVEVYNGAYQIGDDVAPVLTFEALEAELSADRAEDELEPIIHSLSKMEGLTPEANSKFEHALLSLSRTMPGAETRNGGEVEVTTETSELLRRIWREQYTQLLLLEAGVRQDRDIEYVHSMRVTIRRMRAAYLFLGSFFEPDAIQPLVSGLKRAAKILGRVRDLDVLLHGLAHYVEGLEQDEAAEFDALVSHWRCERHQRFGELLDWLESKRYRQLLKKLRTFVENPGLGVEERFRIVHQPPEASQVRHVLPAVLLERFLSVRKYEALFDAYPEAAETVDQETRIEVETLHTLRIECKYLRYTLEFLPTIFEEEGNHLIEQLKKLQNLLGKLNDASVTKGMLSAISKEMHNRVVKEYVKKQDKVIRKMERKAENRVRTFLSAENRASFGIMLGRI